MILRTAAILLISAAIGPQLLRRLGISLDVFQIVGGLVITSIGYGMFAPGPAPVAPTEQQAASENSSSLDPIVLFAASPGTISTVLALSVMVLRPGSSAGRNSSLISRFLGLILIAMGLQFVLTNLRAFFQAAG